MYVRRESEGETRFPIGLTRYASRASLVSRVARTLECVYARRESEGNSLSYWAHAARTRARLPLFKGSMYATCTHCASTMFPRLKTFCETYAQTGTAKPTADQDRLKLYQLYGKTCAAVANYYGVPATPLVDADVVAETAKRTAASPEIRAQYELFSRRLAMDSATRRRAVFPKCMIPQRTDAYMKMLKTSCENTNCFAVRGSAHMLRNVSYAVFMSFVHSESQPQARPVGVSYPIHMRDVDITDQVFDPPVVDRQQQHIRFGLPISTTSSSDMEHSVKYQRPSFVIDITKSAADVPSPLFTNNETVREKALLMLTGNRPPAYIPCHIPNYMLPGESGRVHIPNGADRNTNKYSELPLFANDVLMQECFSHVQECMIRLSSFLGPMDWRAPPRDARTIEAWNSLLRLDGAYIEPHLPSDVELRIFRAEEKMSYTDRIKARVKAMAIQKLNKRNGDTFSDALNLPRQWSRAQFAARTFSNAFALFVKLRGCVNKTRSELQ